MSFRSITPALLALSLAACANSTVRYDPPDPIPVTTSAEINEPFDAVWNKLVRSLSEDFFVINNVEKDSKIINVSFSTNTPDRFISCGYFDRTFTNARGKQAYYYSAANSAKYTATDNKNDLVTVIRTTNLEGRTNIVVTPSDKGSTSVIVNTKYVFTTNFNFINVFGAPAGSSNAILDFTSKQPGVAPTSLPGQPPVTCRANGALEAKILGYVKQDFREK